MTTARDIARGITKNIAKEITGIAGSGAAPVRIAYDFTLNVSATEDLETASSSRTSESGHDWLRLSSAVQRMSAKATTNDATNRLGDADTAMRSYSMDLSGAASQPTEIRAMFVNSGAAVKGFSLNGGIIIRAVDATHYTVCYVAELLTSGNLNISIWENTGAGEVFLSELGASIPLGVGFLGSYPASPVIVKDTGTQIIVDATTYVAGATLTYVGSPSGASKNAGMHCTTPDADKFTFKNFEVFT